MNNQIPFNNAAGRTFRITGEIVQRIKHSDRSYGFLVKDANGVMWLRGLVPEDRIPESSVYAVLMPHQVVTFDVAPTGNLQKLPTKHRVDFTITRVVSIIQKPVTWGRGDVRSISGVFNISGTVHAIFEDYIILKSTPLPATPERPALGSYLIPFPVARPEKFKLGSRICLAGTVRPHDEWSAALGKRVYYPKVVVSEAYAVSNNPAYRPDRTVERKAHWRTTKNGDSVWVSATTVRVPGKNPKLLFAKI